MTALTRRALLAWPAAAAVTALMPGFAQPCVGVTRVRLEKFAGLDLAASADETAIGWCSALASPFRIGMLWRDGKVIYEDPQWKT